VLDYSRNEDAKSRGMHKEIEDLNKVLMQYRRQLEEENLKAS
jgi:hypothetical protein